MGGHHKGFGGPELVKSNELTNDHPLKPILSPLKQPSFAILCGIFRSPFIAGPVRGR